MAKFKTGLGICIKAILIRVNQNNSLRVRMLMRTCSAKPFELKSLMNGKQNSFGEKIKKPGYRRFGPYVDWYPLGTKSLLDVSQKTPT